MRRGKELKVSEQDFTKLKEIIIERKGAFHIIEWVFLKKVLRLRKHD